MVRALLALLLSACSCGALAFWSNTATYDDFVFRGDTAAAVCAKFNAITWTDPWLEGLSWSVSGSNCTAEHPTAGTLNYPLVDCSVGSCPPAERLFSAYGYLDQAPYGYVLAGSGGGVLSAGWLTDLTPEQGGLIAGAILAVWALGWGFRVLIRTLKTVDGETNHESE